MFLWLIGSIDKTTVIIGTSVSAIILIGIAIIIVYKVLLELYDLQEYRSFLRAQEQTDWKEVCLSGAHTSLHNLILLLHISMGTL